jgi:putative peptidoglycan lipid II flippase
MALAYGVFIAGLAQLLFQIPFLGKIHAVPRPRWKPRHDGVRRVGKLMLPAIFGSSVAQVNVLVGGIIASMLGVGKISLLYYSDRLMEFPLGLFSIAIATVTLPQLSRQHARQSMQEFSQIIDWSLKLVFLIALPSAVGLVVLAEPLVATIFFGGEFSAYDVRMTALSLQAFSLGLIGFSLVKILAPAYFAREDTRTPVRIGLIALAVNFVLSVVLAYGLTKAAFEGTHAGLALATSVAAIVNAWLLYRGLRGDRVLSHAKGWSRLLMQFAAANVLMTVSLLLLNRNLDWWLGSSLVDRSLWLALTIFVGGGVYVISLLLFGMRPGALRLRS